MGVADQIKTVRKENELTQQDVADKLSTNHKTYNPIESGNSDPTMNVLEHIATVLEINMIQSSEADKKSKEVNSVIKPLLQKVRLLEELDVTLKNSICNMTDTAIANYRLKKALNNAMNIAI